MLAFLSGLRADIVTCAKEMFGTNVQGYPDMVEST